MNILFIVFAFVIFIILLLGFTFGILILAKTFEKKPKIHHYELQWYHPENSELDGKETIESTEMMFKVSPEYFLAEQQNKRFFPVQATEKSKIQPKVKHNIDLNSFNYFVVAMEK